jgi:hypothetical protein
MPKTKPKKGFFRLVHLEALAVLAVYFIVSNYVLVSSVANESMWISFLGPLLFGIAASFAFLYLFGHQDFFHFIRKFEDEEMGKEKKYLNRFKHLGKILACVLVSGIGGPIFLALTVRFLFSEKENRYLMVLISTLISTLVIVAFAKGFWKIFF